MVLPPVIRRQRPGVRAQQITVSLPGAQMERLRKEAFAKKVTVSKHIADLLQSAWESTDEEAA